MRNGQLINDYLNPMIFSNTENEKSLISQKQCKLERFRQKVWPAWCTQSHLTLFAKSRFPTIFGRHLEFVCKIQKQKYTFISETLHFGIKGKTYYRKMVIFQNH